MPTQVCHRVQGLSSFDMNYWQISLVHTSYPQVGARPIFPGSSSDSLGVKFHDRTWHYTIYSTGAFRMRSITTDLF